MEKVIGIIETVTALGGLGILWWRTDFWIAIAVFLLMTSLYQRMEMNIWRIKK